MADEPLRLKIRCEASREFPNTFLVRAQHDERSPEVNISATRVLLAMDWRLLDGTARMDGREVLRPGI